MAMAAVLLYFITNEIIEVFPTNYYKREYHYSSLIIVGHI